MRQKANGEPASARSFINQHSSGGRGHKGLSDPSWGHTGHWSSQSCIFNSREFDTKPPLFPLLTFYWFEQFSAIVCLGIAVAPCACCRDLQGIPCSPLLQPAQTPRFILTLLPGEFHHPHFPSFPLFLSLNTEGASQGVPNSSKRLFLCTWRSFLAKQTCPHWAALSRPTERL